MLLLMCYFYSPVSTAYDLDNNKNNNNVHSLVISNLPLTSCHFGNAALRKELDVRLFKDSLFLRRR